MLHYLVLLPINGFQRGTFIRTLPHYSSRMPFLCLYRYGILPDVLGCFTNLLVYMPTLSTAIFIAIHLKILMKDFPTHSRMGTHCIYLCDVGGDLTGFKNSVTELYVGGASALMLGSYALTLLHVNLPRPETNPCFFFLRAGCICIIQKKENGYFLLVFHALFLGKRFQVY